jgi:hypothetical protein
MGGGTTVVENVLLAYVLPPLFGLGVYTAFVRKPRAVEAAAVSWGIGWGAVNLLSFSANQFGGVPLDGAFYAATAAGLGVAGLALLLLGRKRLRHLTRNRSVPPDLRRGTGLAVLVLLGAFAALVLYKGLTIPPASTDAVVYHMRLPKLAFETGALAARPGVGWLDVVTAFPNLLVTQQLWIYLGAGGFNEVLVRPIMPVYTVLLLALVFVDARRWFGLVPAALAAAGLVSLNEFASLTIVLWAEVPVAFYAYLAVRSAVEATQRGTSLVLAGGFAGAAALVKYNGLVVFVALALALLLLPRWRGRAATLAEGRPMARPSPGRVATFVAAGALVAAPLLVRNALVFGNPVYPFFFGGVNTAQLAYFFEAYSPEDLVRIRLFEAVVLLGSVLTAAVVVGSLRLRRWSWQERLLFLFLVLYLPVYLYLPLRGSYIRYLAPVLPALAILAARQLAWWLTDADPHERRRGAFAVLALVALVAAILTALDVRPPYLVEFAAFFVGSAAVVLGLVALKARIPGPSGQTAAVVALTAVLLVPGLFAVAAERYPPRETAWDVAFPPPDAETYLATRFGDDWRMWKWINANLPPDALVLTFEPRLLYVDADVMFAAAYELIPTYAMSLDEAVAFVRGLGVGYVLDSPWSHIPEINRIFWERNVVFQNLDDETRFRPVHAEGEVVLYELVG